MEKQHKMELVKKYETGATEWRCKECSRHLIMQASPFKRISLCEGDQDAIHIGGQISMGVETQDSSSQDLNFDGHSSGSKTHH